MAQSAGFDDPRASRDSNETRVRNKARDSYNKRLVLTVISAWAEAKNLPTICVANPDRDAVQSRRWSPQSCHYAIDVERATVEGLKGEPALQKAWHRIAQGERVRPELQREVIRRCSRFYAGRKLDPHSYFRGKMGAA